MVLSAVMVALLSTTTLALADEVAENGSPNDSAPSIDWNFTDPYSLIPNPSDASTQATTGKTQAMYRLYNKWTGEHHYTAKTAERDTLINAKWSYEGIGWFAPTTSSTPVYRLTTNTLQVENTTTQRVLQSATIS